jgi:type II secretory pathway pseudopilin PulG
MNKLIILLVVTLILIFLYALVLLPYLDEQSKDIQQDKATLREQQQLMNLIELISKKITKNSTMLTGGYASTMLKDNLNIVALSNNVLLEMDNTTPCASSNQIDNPEESPWRCQTGKLSATSFLDNKFWVFLDSIRQQLPGVWVTDSFTIKKQQEPDAITVEALTRGENVPIVKMDLTYRWYYIE